VVGPWRQLALLRHCPYGKGYWKSESSHERCRNFSRWEPTWTFCLSSLGCWRCSENGPSQNSLQFLHHKENVPRMHVLHSHLFWNLFQAACIRMCHKGVLSIYPLQLLLNWSIYSKCRYRCELHRSESEMDLNYQQLRLRLVCVCWTKLTSVIFCKSFLHFGYRKCFFS